MISEMCSLRLQIGSELSGFAEFFAVFLLTMITYMAPVVVIFVPRLF